MRKIWLVLVIAALTGCASHQKVTEINGGYEEVTHPRRLAMDAEDTRVSLEYHALNGQPRLIWPSLYGVKEIVHDDIVLFVGDKAYINSDPDDPRGTRPRLFAARPDELPLDITDEVLGHWAKAAGKDYSKARQYFSMALPIEVNNGLQVRLAFDTNDRDWPDETMLQLDWNDISDYMRAVKAHGAEKKDLRWHTPFIE